MNPYFSVVIPLYNKANEIRHTLECVFSQSFTNFEVIVINDGSTDDSLDIVQAFDDHRLHIYSTKNKGVSHARNYGIQKAKAKRIAFLDADDIWKPHHLEDLKALFETFPNCGLYCMAYDKIKGETMISSHYKDIPQNKPWKGRIDDYFYHSSVNSLASSSSVGIYKAVLDTVGYFNEAFDSGEDTDLWIRIALAYPTAFDTTVSATHNLNAHGKQTNTTLKGRHHFDLDAFKVEEQSNASLKRYLDLNRYALAIQYKLEGEQALSKEMYDAIDKKSLSTVQKMVYGSPKGIIKLILNLRDLLRLSGINLRLFR